MYKEGDKLGSYTLVEKLGHGTFARVFKVQDDEGNFYALKAMQVSKEKKKFIFIYC
jgi:serine/threonine protein kinase